MPIRTTESAEEYAKMTRAQRDEAKDRNEAVAHASALLNVVIIHIKSILLITNKP